MDFIQDVLNRLESKTGVELYYAVYSNEERETQGLALLVRQNGQTIASAVFCCNDSDSDRFICKDEAEILTALRTIHSALQERFGDKYFTTISCGDEMEDGYAIVKSYGADYYHSCDPGYFYPPSEEGYYVSPRYLYSALSILADLGYEAGTDSFFHETLPTIRFELVAGQNAALAHVEACITTIDQAQQNHRAAT